MSRNTNTKTHLFLPALAIAGLLVACSVLTLIQAHSVSAYPYGCVSEACRAASDAADAAAAKAAEATDLATTLEEEVSRLNTEIAALEAEITANQAVADDLSAQIATNQQKLDLQQLALAQLLVDIHFEGDPDAILLLAGSSSLGDYAEKQSRQTTVKTQVAASATEIRELKAELETQKASVDALIANAEASRNEIANKRNQQNSLMERYKDNADAYAADAAAAREIMQQEIADEIAKYNTGGVVGDGYNSYPYAAACPGINLNFLYSGGYVCQCTSYAGWKTLERFGISINSWGNARDWVNNYSNSKSARGADGAYHSYRIDTTPAPYTVAISTLGEYGHVMWVESVNSNGTINLTEYNNLTSSVSGQWADFGARYNVSPAGLYFIHFDQPIY